MYDSPKKSAAHDNLFSCVSNTLRYRSTQLDRKKGFVTDWGSMTCCSIRFETRPTAHIFATGSPAFLAPIMACLIPLLDIFIL
jgi:hypothetical protein